MAAVRYCQPDAGGDGADALRGGPVQDETPAMRGGAADQLAADCTLTAGGRSRLARTPKSDLAIRQ